MLPAPFSSALLLNFILRARKFWQRWGDHRHTAFGGGGIFGADKKFFLAVDTRMKCGMIYS